MEKRNKDKKKNNCLSSIAHKMESENISGISSPFEFTKEIILTRVKEEEDKEEENVIVNENIGFSSVWCSPSDHSYFEDEMEINFPLSESQTEDVISLSLDENPITGLVTDGIFPGLDCDYDSIFEGSLSPDYLSSDFSETSCKTSDLPKTKRGRKSKAERSLFIPKPKPQKTRIYEIATSFDDKALERRRLCAINAKKHRDSQKNQMKVLEQKIQEVARERDSIKSEKECLAKSVDNLSQQLELYKKHLLDMASTSVTMLQSAP